MDRATAAPAGETIEIEDVPLHYVARGRGPAVILIHGASGNLRDWTLGAAQAMAEDHAVLAFDRPGLGFSGWPGEGGASPFVQADLMRRAAARLGHERAVLVGHSYGGSVALAWALDAPASVRGLLLLAAPSQVWGGGLAISTEVLANPLAGPLATRVAPLIASEAFVTRAIGTVFAPEPAPPGYARHLGLELLTDPRILRRNAHQLGALKGHIRRMVPRYPTLDIPTELLHGTEDETVPLHIHSARTVHALPRANLVRLEGAGHMIHHTRLAEVLVALARLEARL